MKRVMLFAVVVILLSSGCQVVANFVPTQTPYPTYTPYPTQTPYPTLTPLPSPTATPEKAVLYAEDDFTSVDNCFPVFTETSSRVLAEDGELHIVVQDLNYYVWSVCDKDFRNFILDVDVTVDNGPSNGDYAFGVILRNNPDPGGFYAFLIAANGNYNFSYYNLGEFVEDYPILFWSTIREIRQGRNTNHLRIVAVGDQFELYVNDVLVGLVRDGFLRSGEVGFIVKTFETPGDVRVIFDNLVITEP